jgi:hypothetical protein
MNNKNRVIKKCVLELEKASVYPDNFDDYYYMRNYSFYDDDKIMRFYNLKKDLMVCIDITDFFAYGFTAYDKSGLHIGVFTSKKNKIYYFINDLDEMTYLKEYLKNRGMKVNFCKVPPVLKPPVLKQNGYRYKIAFKNKADEAHFVILMNDIIYPLKDGKKH